MKVGAVILAAGLSSRMGAFKPLLCLGDKTVLAHAVELFRRSGVRSILVVIGYRGDEVRAEAERLGVRWVVNSDYRRGMFSSVQAGVAGLPRVDAFFLLPVDIPLVRPSTLKTLLASFVPKMVVSPAFGDSPGFPPLIPAQLINPILRYDGPEHLDSLLQTQARQVPVWDRGVVLDADTPDEWQELQRRLARLTVGEMPEAAALATLAMPARGLAHGRVTARVAMAIGRRLNEQGLALDLELIHNAALLHDIAKGRRLHELRGSQLLMKLGLDGLADIVAAHRDIEPPQSGEVTEKEVVGLADKLVSGNRTVTVVERFDEKLARYAANKKICRVIRQRRARVQALQELIEQRLDCPIAAVIAGGDPESSAAG